MCNGWIDVRIDKLLQEIKLIDVFIVAYGMLILDNV